MVKTLHTIRLGGPWEIAGRRIQLPHDWPRLSEVSTGECHLLRKFGAPTGVESTQQVWLVIDELLAGCQVVLNDLVLPTDGGSHWDISTLIEERNRLRITAPICDVPLFAEVRLEIRAEA